MKSLIEFIQESIINESVTDSDVMGAIEEIKKVFVDMSTDNIKKISDKLESIGAITGAFMIGSSTEQAKKELKDDNLVMMCQLIENTKNFKSLKEKTGIVNLGKYFTGRFENLEDYEVFCIFKK